MCMAYAEREPAALGVSGDIEFLSGRPGLVGGFHPVPAGLFGPVQGLVGCLNYLFNRTGPSIRLRHPDADGDGEIERSVIGADASPLAQGGRNARVGPAIAAAATILPSRFFGGGVSARST